VGVAGFERFPEIRFPVSLFVFGGHRQAAIHYCRHSLRLRAGGYRSYPILAGKVEFGPTIRKDVRYAVRALRRSPVFRSSQLLP
jgi:hypothetical protein